MMIKQVHYALLLPADTDNVTPRKAWIPAHD